MPSLFQKIFQTGIVTEPLGPNDLEVVELIRQIDQKTQRLLGRSLAIREVDAGSCNGCEIEITGLTNPVYDSERFGIHFVASPRHADMLLVTGPVTRNMEVPLKKPLMPHQHPSLWLPSVTVPGPVEYSRAVMPWPEALTNLSR